MRLSIYKSHTSDRSQSALNIWSPARVWTVRWGVGVCSGTGCITYNLWLLLKSQTHMCTSHGLVVPVWNKWRVWAGPRPVSLFRPVTPFYGCCSIKYEDSPVQIPSCSTPYEHPPVPVPVVPRTPTCSNLVYLVVPPVSFQILGNYFYQNSIFQNTIVLGVEFALNSNLVIVIFMLRVLTYADSHTLFWDSIGVVRLVSDEILFDKGFLICHSLHCCSVQIVSLWSLSIGVQIIFTTNELVNRLRNLKSSAPQND